MRNRLLLTTAITPVLMLAGVAPSLAQQGMPAVAYPNVTLGGSAGSWFDEVFGVAEGRLTVPLDHAFGAQLDGVAGSIGGEAYGHIGGHAFWRAPTSGLFGLYGAWVHQGGMGSGRIGPEAELYFDKLTLSGVAGWTFGDGRDGDFFTHAKASLYLDPNHKFYAGYSYEGGSAGVVGFEAFHPGPRISGFAEARIATDHYAAMGGLRFLSGAPGKSLMDREREDVVPLWMHVAEEETTPAPTTAAPSTQPP